MELSKDGRWLGGRAPTGFTTKRVSVGSGKNKTAITYLVSLDDERTFCVIRSIVPPMREPINTSSIMTQMFTENHRIMMDIRAFRCIIELISIRSRTMIPHSSVPSSHRAGETGMYRSGSSRSADTKGSYPQRNGYRPKSCWRRSLRDITVRIGVLTRCLPD